MSATIETSAVLDGETTTGRVEIGPKTDEGDLYFEVFDKDFWGKTIQACVVLTRDQAEAVAQALLEEFS